MATSQIPWNGPLGAIRVTKNDGKWIFNSNYAQRKESEMDLTLSAIEKDGDILVNMIEMGAKEIVEKEVLEAYEVAKKELKKMIEAQMNAVKKIGIKKDEFVPAVELDLAGEIKEFLGDRFEKAINDAPKGEKNLGATEELKIELIGHLTLKYPSKEKKNKFWLFLKKKLKR